MRTDRVGGIDRKLGFEAHVQIVNESPKLVMDTYGQSFVFVSQNKITHPTERDSYSSEATRAKEEKLAA